VRQVQEARRKGETPPQEPSLAKRDRTMFSHCIFNLEDTVLDCVDTKLRELGWGVDSLIYDGVRRNEPSTDSPPTHSNLTASPLLSPAALVACTYRCTFAIATIAMPPT